ncbi:retrovirus-related pol polyprotein from transposon TNT 1-94 [Tanacetum coccineum]
MQMVGGNGGNQFRQYAGQNVGNLNKGLGHLARNCTVRPRKKDDAFLQTQLLIAQKEEEGIQLQAEKFDFMAAAGDLEDIEETDNAPVYDLDGSIEEHEYENCYNNEIFNMFTQEEQYTELLDPIPKPHQVQQNDSNVISAVSSVEQSGRTVEQHPDTAEETQQCLTKKINALHLSSTKMITTLNEEIANLNNQLSKEKSTVSFFNEEKKKLKSDFKIREDELLDKQIQLENKIKELDNILEAAKFVRDFKSLTKEADESLDKHKALEFEIERLLRAVVSQDIMSIVQSNSVVDTSNLQTELDPYKDMQQKIEWLQAQLGDLRGKCEDTRCESSTLDPLSQKLENENMELEFQLHDMIYENAKLRDQLFDKVSEQKDITKGSSKVIASRMFRINPFKTSREDKFVPINKVRASVRINSITVSQPYVITKKDVNSNSNGLSSTGVDITTKTKRPQPRSNTKNDRVPSMSKSSCIKNKEVKVEEHHRNLLLSKNKKHMSSGCNNVKLAIRNDKYEVVPTIKRFPNSTSFLGKLSKFVYGIVRFRNDHVAAILGYVDLKWGNILITRVYFVEGLGHNLFSVGQFCDSDLEVAFKRNTCFVRNLEGVDLLKGNHTTNLYTINLHEMASASPIFLMAHATSTNKEKSKKASHPSKHVPNSKQMLHLLHMDLCGPMRVESINGKRYILVIVDDYSRYTWVHFLRSKDEALEVIKTFLKKIQILLQAPVIIIRTENGTEFKNQVLKEYFDSVGISHQAALCYQKNDREDIGKLGAKGDIGFFIGYSANSYAYRVYNRRTKKIMETMNVTFDELSAMALNNEVQNPGFKA